MRLCICAADRAGILHSERTNESSGKYLASDRNSVNFPSSYSDRFPAADLL